MKKIVIFLLVNLIIMSTLCVSAAVRNIGDIYKSKDGQFRVQIRDDETLMIHKYLGDSDKLIIPDKIDGVKVTRIRGDGIPITVKSIKLGKNIDYVTSTRLAARKNIEEITVDTNNKYFYSKDGVLYNKEKTKVIAYPANRKQTKISILNSVKYIEKYAFTGNRNLKTIEIGKNIISVGEEAFCGCKCAETVIIPKNVKIIGKNAFADCKKLTTIKISGSKKLVINDFAFSDNTALKKVRFPIYNDENSGTRFFLFCNHLKNVTISKGVRSIPISCFNGCSKLKKVKFSNTVKTLRGGCFYNCQSLKSLTIPSTVTTIEKNSVGFHDNDYATRIIKVEDIEIKGSKGSAAHKYAKANGLKFKAIK